MNNQACVHAFERKVFVYNSMSFGNWLRKQLNTRALSNAEFARLIGVSPTYVGNLVRDYSPNMTANRAPRPGEAIVEKMAIILNVPLNEVRRAANYAPIEEEDDGLYDGFDELSPEMKVLARQQIRGIIDSLVAADKARNTN